MWIDPFSRKFLNGAGLIPASEGRGPVVLMYHSIEPEGKSPTTIWSISAKAFKSHLRLLKSEGWHTACACDLFQARTFPPRTVIITFDDGYANNFEDGFNALARYGMQATWFIVTRDIGKLSRWPDPGQPTRPMLNEDQLCQMSQAGMEIGAHTRTHPHLPTLGYERIWEEISESKNELEDILGQTVTSFAYPYGEYNEDCVKAVRQAGYRVACTVRPGWFGSESDLLRVRRVAVFSHDSLSSFARKLAFADTGVGWRRMANYAAGRLGSRLSRR